MFSFSRSANSQTGPEFNFLPPTGTAFSLHSVILTDENCSTECLPGFLYHPELAGLPVYHLVRQNTTALAFIVHTVAFVSAHT